MDHDLGAFWPARPGTDSMLYHALSGQLQLARLNPYLAWEIAVACSTPGFGPRSWAVVLGWGPHALMLAAVEQVIAAHTRSQDLIIQRGYENSLTITRQDGLDWLRATLMRKPWYTGPVPVWTKRALRELREERGFTNLELATELGVPNRVKHIAAWITSVAHNDG